jgi:hypothetical protein
VRLLIFYPQLCLERDLAKKNRPAHQVYPAEELVMLTNGVETGDIDDIYEKMDEKVTGLQANYSPELLALIAPHAKKRLQAVILFRLREQSEQFDASSKLITEHEERCAQIQEKLTLIKKASGLTDKEWEEATKKYTDAEMPDDVAEVQQRKYCYPARASRHRKISDIFTPLGYKTDGTEISATPADTNQ